MKEICAHLFSCGYRNPAYMYGPKSMSSALGRRRNFNSFWENKTGSAPTEVEAAAYSSTALDGGDERLSALDRERPEMRCTHVR